MFLNKQNNNKKPTIKHLGLKGSFAMLSLRASERRSFRNPTESTATEVRSSTPIAGGHLPGRLIDFTNTPTVRFPALRSNLFLLEAYHLLPQAYLLFVPSGYEAQLGVTKMATVTVSHNHRHRHTKVTEQR